MLKPLLKFIRAISSNTNPTAIAAAFAFGILLGFVPKNNLLWYILTVFILFLNIQRGTYALSIALGALLSPLLDPLFDTIGWAVLTWDKAVPAFTWLLNIPFVSFTKINNTIVQGSLIAGLALFAPLYFLMLLIVRLWRKYLADKIRNSRIINTIKKLNLFKNLKEKLEDLE